MVVLKILWESLAMPRDNNGVNHDGWANVALANQYRRGHSGKADKDYEYLARKQKIDLSKTCYRQTSGYQKSRL